MTSDRTPPPVYKRYHTRLLVDRFSECFRFYRDVLALPVRYRNETTGYAEFKSDGVHLALFSRQDMAAAIGHSGPEGDPETLDRAVIVLRVDDVDSTAAGIQQRGGRLQSPPTYRPDWGCRTAHFRDPDGNLIEINGDL